MNSEYWMQVESVRLSKDDPRPGASIKSINSCLVKFLNQDKSISLHMFYADYTYAPRVGDSWRITIDEGMPCSS
jgi:hypothetical protein